MAITESRDITIEATPEEILDVLYDVEKLPEWSPTHKKVVVLERDDEGRPSKSQESVKIVGIGEDQVLAYTRTGSDGRNVLVAINMGTAPAPFKAAPFVKDGARLRTITASNAPTGNTVTSPQVTLPPFSVWIAEQAK